MKNGLITEQELRDANGTKTCIWYADYFIKFRAYCEGRIDENGEPVDHPMPPAEEHLDDDHSRHHHDEVDHSHVQSDSNSGRNHSPGT